MISQIRGQVLTVSLSAAVVEVGGVGLHLRCTPRTLAHLRRGEQAVLFTSLVVREDSLTLFGFESEDERDMFELVQTASGVGPKVAQSMLAVLPPDRLRIAIAGADHSALTAVPGIGRKGAERIVVELKDRVGEVASSAQIAGGVGWKGQVHEALLGLGWSARDADQAIEQTAQITSTTPDQDVSELLRIALRSLARS